MLTASVVIPWANRPELEDTLAQNRPVFDEVGADVVIVNCGGQSGMINSILANHQGNRIRHLEIMNPSFNKALSLNIGVLHTRSDCVLLLDADIVLQSAFLRNALDAINIADSFVTPEWVVESIAYSGPPSHVRALIQRTQLLLQNGRIVEFEQDRRRFADGSRGGLGEILIGRKQFVDVGGMNSRLLYWGGEDLDFHIRLCAELGLHRVCLGEVVHLTHGDKKRMLLRDSKSTSSEFNLAVAYEQYSKGNFIGTLLHDEAICKDAVRFVPHVGVPAPRLCDV
jgi:glycosyltransferase involved in cell wall biosynthesis